MRSSPGGLQRLRGGASQEGEEDSEDALGGILGKAAPRLSDREVRRVARAAAIDALRREEAAEQEALQKELPGGSWKTLAGWNPTALREFRAGVMQVEADGKRLRPLPAKGVLFLEASDADGLTHLMWKPREAAGPASASFSPASTPSELDLLLLPDDAQMDRVSDFNGHPVTAARIYRLSYSDGDAYYFWMQEPSIEPDDVFFNRVQHVLAPPVYNPDAPNKGWTWESHMAQSVKHGLHLKLMTSTGEASAPEYMPPEHAKESWWIERAAAIRDYCYLQWLPRAKGDAALHGGAVGEKCATPSMIPRGGSSWIWWEPGGATQVTHWDPISIVCPTPDATIYYKIDIDYDEAWVLDDDDPLPLQIVYWPVCPPEARTI